MENKQVNKHNHHQSTPFYLCLVLLLFFPLALCDLNVLGGIPGGLSSVEANQLLFIKLLVIFFFHLEIKLFRIDCCLFYQRINEQSINANKKLSHLDKN